MTGLLRIFAVARIELLRLLRLRMAFTLLLLVPALQVLLFGYAIRPTAITTGIAVAGPTPDIVAMIAKPLKDAELTIVRSDLKPGDAEAMVRNAQALIGIEAPRMGVGAGPMRIIVDAANASLTAVAVPRIEAAYWQTRARLAGVPENAQGPRIERLYNRDARADWTFLPSLIGVTTMISMIMLGTLSLAREREGGTWEALLILPISAFEALCGKLLPYIAIGTMQGALVLLAGIALFDLPARGSVTGLMILLPLFAAAHLVLGYAISARAATQLAALQGAVAFYLPAMLLSGFLYPFETLPRWAQTLGSVFPLTHFIRAAQDALLRGADMAAILVHGLAIALFFLAVLGLALLAHTRRLD